MPKEVFLKILEVSIITYEDLRLKHQCDSFENRDHGSAVMICEGQEGVFATVWVGVNNVSLMVNKEEIKSFRFLIQRVKLVINKLELFTRTQLRRSWTVPAA